MVVIIDFPAGRFRTKSDQVPKVAYKIIAQLSILTIYVLFNLCFQHTALAVGNIAGANLFVYFFPQTVLPVGVSSQER